jgi:hypothetical protein
VIQCAKLAIKRPRIVFSVKAKQEKAQIVTANPGTKKPAFSIVKDVRFNAPNALKQIQPIA